MFVHRRHGMAAAQTVRLLHLARTMKDVLILYRVPSRYSAAVLMAKHLQTGSTARAVT